MRRGGRHDGAGGGRAGRGAARPRARRTGRLVAGGGRPHLDAGRRRGAGGQPARRRWAPRRARPPCRPCRPGTPAARSSPRGRTAPCACASACRGWCPFTRAPAGGRRLRGAAVRRRAERGQSSVELLALIPVLIVVGLLGWQLSSVVVTGLRAQAEVRARAVKAVAAYADRQVIVSVLLPVPGRAARHGGPARAGPCRASGPRDPGAARPPGRAGAAARPGRRGGAPAGGGGALRPRPRPAGGGAGPDGRRRRRAVGRPGAERPDGGDRPRQSRAARGSGAPAGARRGGRGRAGRGAGRVADLPRARRGRRSRSRWSSAARARAACGPGRWRGPGWSCAGGARRRGAVGLGRGGRVLGPAASTATASRCARRSRRPST